jgi:AcrR family transcriptional regulator
MTARKSKGVVPREDHRVRVAREKRERMRDHLLGAVLAVYPGKPGQGPAVTDDVIRVAKVSRGTFYKYYPSLEEAVAELGAKLAAEMVAAIGALYDSLEDPSDRLPTVLIAGDYRAEVGCICCPPQSLEARSPND